MLLFVTDSSLQDVAHGIPKVVAVSVTSSCVLSMEVIEALSAGCQLFFFKDALWGNGKLCTWFGVPQKQHPYLWHHSMWPPERSRSLSDEDETLQVWDEKFERDCNLNFLLRFLFLYFWLDLESEGEIHWCCSMSTSITVSLLWWLFNLMTNDNQICELTEGSKILRNLHVLREILQALLNHLSC